MSPEDYIAKPILTPRDAIATQVRWKITLQMAITLREPLSARATQSIENPNLCSIGEWLVSGHSAHLRGTPEYRAALDCHANSHREMLTLANLINSGQFEAAERLHSSRPYHDASNAIANAIMALDRLQRIRPAS